jgi:2-polyprenyl-3-methyl-5-hydroxy-6-metoxy-1,4-benzoquinol methylase
MRRESLPEDRSLAYAAVSVAPAPAADLGYFDNARDDVVALLRRPLGRVLDVGCGAGAVGAGLRAAGAEHLIGVEVVPEAAARARERYDEVIEAPIEEALGRLHGPFDTILCLDVLEHLVDPEAVLRALRGLAAADGRLQVSVPNARHVSLVWDLVVRGTFGYADWGHRDRTHLRWFTRADMAALLEATRWRVTATSHPALRRSQGLARLTRGRSTEFLVGQWYLAAEAA